MEYLHAQAEELVTNYGRVDVLWWDYSSQDFQGDEAWRAIGADGHGARNSNRPSS